MHHEVLRGFLNAPPAQPFELQDGQTLRRRILGTPMHRYLFPLSPQDGQFPAEEFNFAEGMITLASMRKTGDAAEASRTRAS